MPKKKVDLIQKKMKSFLFRIKCFFFSKSWYMERNKFLLTISTEFTSQEEHIMKLAELAARRAQSWHNTHFWWMKYQTKLCKNKEQTRSWFWNYTPKIYLAVASHCCWCLLLTSIKPLVLKSRASERLRAVDYHFVIVKGVNLVGYCETIFVHVLCIMVVVLKRERTYLAVNGESHLVNAKRTIP